ncbi:hypothetical protein [Celeribacter naphthalenivorans]|uniref:hypothetical protein n=1 Tax=Celeribacter naphthalenivorans TaxID=1614694 RepID=UPI001CFAC508|nr:hypothetical protein [Celeribacter naphthalenivorans]
MQSILPEDVEGNTFSEMLHSFRKLKISMSEVLKTDGDILQVFEVSVLMDGEADRIETGIACQPLIFTSFKDLISNLKSLGLDAVSLPLLPGEVIFSTEVALKVSDSSDLILVG